MGGNPFGKARENMRLHGKHQPKRKGRCRRTKHKEKKHETKRGSRKMQRHRNEIRDKKGGGKRRRRLDEKRLSYWDPRALGFMAGSSGSHSKRFVNYIFGANKGMIRTDRLRRGT